MSVISSKLQAKNATMEIDAEFRRAYTHDFIVETNSDTDMQVAVYLQSESVGPFSVPKIGTHYDINGNSDLDYLLERKIIKRSTDDEGNKRTWIVTCIWAQPLTGFSLALANNPLNWPVRYNLEWANYSRAFDTDIFGNKLINSANDPFPAEEQDDARPVLVATKNEFPLEAIVAKSIFYKNAVNTDPFYGAMAREAKVESIVTGELQSLNGFQYYPVTYRVQFNEKKWDLVLADIGFNAYNIAKNNPNAVKGPILNANGLPVLEEQPLNLDGTWRDPATVLFGQELILDKSFRVYPERAFSGLGI